MCIFILLYTCVATVVTKNGGTEVRFSPNTTLSAVQWKFFPKLLQHEYTGSCVYNSKRKLRYRRIFMCGVSSICKKSVNRDLKKYDMFINMTCVRLWPL